MQDHKMNGHDELRFKSVWRIILRAAGWDDESVIKWYEGKANLHEDELPHKREEKRDHDPSRIFGSWH